MVCFWVTGWGWGWVWVWDWGRHFEGDIVNVAVDCVQMGQHSAAIRSGKTVWRGASVSSMSILSAAPPFRGSGCKFRNLFGNWQAVWRARSNTLSVREALKYKQH